LRSVAHFQKPGRSVCELRAEHVSRSSIIQGEAHRGLAFFRVGVERLPRKETGRADRSRSP
jgi:hypothetical protein